MIKSRVALRATALVATLTFSSVVLAASISADTLFARASSTCGGLTDYKQCPQSGLPDNFCCASGSSCISLAGATTVLCCPGGADGCDVVAAISCDLSLQDAEKDAAAQVKTTALSAKLPTCGSNCCPFGYTCNENGHCEKNKDQSKKPGTASSSSPGSSTTSADGSSQTGDDSSSDSQNSSGGSNTAAIIGGVIGALAAIAIVIVAVILCRRRRRERAKEDEKNRPDSVHSWDGTKTVRNISNPKPHLVYPHQRTDFVAKQTLSVSSQADERSDPFPDHKYQYEDPGRQPYEAHYGGQGDDAARRTPRLPRFSLTEEDDYDHHDRIGAWMGDDEKKRDQQRQSAKVLPLRSLRKQRSGGGGGGRDLTGPHWRQDSNESGKESINVFADPSSLRPPPTPDDDRGEMDNRRDTTWSTMIYNASQPHGYK